MADARLIDKGDGYWLLEGELGFSSVPAVLEHAGVEMLGNAALKVDLKGVSRADSAGLALLVEWLRESERNGNEISFINVPVQLVSIARVCGLHEILSFPQQV
ncbi:MAG: STAS domain-containing protein [Gammaproteobacteria bacterium]|jgi:phospholipid transport system transporter-binding protein|nr:STAS domain-containing protein [Gammaproteobacteria bacterium]